MTSTSPNTGSSKTDTSQTTTNASQPRPDQPRPEMTVEELLNFSFRDVPTPKLGNIVRARGLSCS